MKRLAKVERSIQEKLKKQAKRYNKSYPGEMVYVDTKRLSLLKGQKATDKRDYLRPLQNSPKSPKFPSRHLGDFS